MGKPPPKPPSLSRFLVFLVRLGTLIALTLGAQRVYVLLEPNGCTMTYMWPNFHHIFTENGYSLSAYTEANLQFTGKGNGIPILYIPGNAASGRQVRSFASNAARQYSVTPVSLNFVDGLHTFQSIATPQLNELDYYFVHFDEEMAIFDGEILEKQTKFVTRCLAYISSLYGDEKNVILIGHSLGGMVARAAAVSSDIPDGLVQTVITISTPHLVMPVVTSSNVNSFYTRVNNQWEQRLRGPESHLSNLVLLSIAGGLRDVQVREELSDTASFCPPTHCLSVVSTAVPDVWISTDHQAGVWCNELVHKVNTAIFAMIDMSSLLPDSSPFARIHAIRRVFLGTLHAALSPALTKHPLPFHPPSIQRGNCSMVQEEFGVSHNDRDRAFSGGSVRVVSPDSNTAILWMLPSNTVHTVLVADGDLNAAVLYENHCQALSAHTTKMKHHGLTMIALPPNSEGTFPMLVVKVSSGTSFLVGVTLNASTGLHESFGMKPLHVPASSGLTMVHFSPLPLTSSVMPQFLSRVGSPVAGELFAPIWFEATSNTIIANRLGRVPQLDLTNNHNNGRKHDEHDRTTLFGSVRGYAGVAIISDPATDITVKFSPDVVTWLGYIVRQHGEIILSGIVGLVIYLLCGAGNFHAILVVTILLCLPGADMRVDPLHAVVLSFFSWGVYGVLTSVVWAMAAPWRMLSLRMCHNISRYMFFPALSLGLIHPLLGIVPLMIITQINNDRTRAESQARRRMACLLLIFGLLQIPAAISALRRADQDPFWFITAKVNPTACLLLAPIAAVVYACRYTSISFVLNNDRAVNITLLLAAIGILIFSHTHVYRVCEGLTLAALALVIIGITKRQQAEFDAASKLHEQ